MADKYAAYEIKTRTTTLVDEKDDNNMILAEARFFPFPSNIRQHQQKAVQPKTDPPYFARWNYPFSAVGLTNVKAKPTIIELHDTRKTNLELKHFTSSNLALISGKAKVKYPPPLTINHPTTLFFRFLAYPNPRHRTWRRLGGHMAGGV